MPQTKQLIHPMRAHRGAAGMTQQDVALASGVPRSRIHSIETGRVRTAHYADLVAIARAIGDDVSWRDLIGVGQAILAESAAELAEVTSARPMAADCEDILATLARAYGRDSSNPEDRAWLGELVQSWAAASAVTV